MSMCKTYKTRKGALDMEWNNKVLLDDDQESCDKAKILADCFLQ